MAPAAPTSRKATALRSVVKRRAATTKRRLSDATAIAQAALIRSVLGVLLARRCDQARIDDLTRHGDIARFSQRRIEPCQQRLDGAGLGQFGPKIAADLRKRRPQPYTTWPSADRRTASLRRSADPNGGRGARF
jgi:hypothetical protein